MKTIRKYRQAFLLGTTFCMLFFALTFPCGAQEAGGTLSEYQAADNSDDEEFTDDSEDDSAKPVFTVSGKLETAHGLRWNKGAEYSLSRSIAQIKGEVLAGSAYAFLSASAEYNYRNPARTGFKLNEAYFRYSGEIWDLSFGRQLINWGQADGFSLTDVLSAKDSSAFLAFSSDDTKLASDSIRLRFFHDIFTFEAVAVPFFTPNKLPRFGFEDGAKVDLYYIDTPDSYDTKTVLGSIPIKYTKTETKPKMFTDTEAAARFSFFLPGIDFSVSGFYGWDKNPLFVKRGNVKKGLFNPANPFGPLNPYVPKELHINLNKEYSRIGMAGIDAAIPAGDITIRLEAAWVGGRSFEPKKQIPALNGAQLLDGTSGADVPLSFDPAVRKHQLLALAGFDWIKNSWTLSAQYFEDLILDHKNDIERPMHKGFVSLNISKTFLRDTLKVSASGAVDINYGSTFSTYAVDYSLTDNMHVILGGDLYTKGYDGKGDFAQLNKISSIWVKGRFNW
ncbi:capsule assembly Wzi family protein [Treponema denticola]|uniref:capsule assembly Wzi family protein n=1 Tax=Treponema denticola TaxID=158 RepID=UPI0020A5655A|nr:capsule assembly Wzi family protein [Treponema denticola]UTC92311.1 capsule assembly Wzi family protein [Treponema denticola]UYT08711.1 capsule assembly Wzi family protein [Treponema denticola]